MNFINRYNQPGPLKYIINWVLMAFTISGLGSLISLKYNEYNGLGFFILFIFTLVNLLIENYLQNKASKLSFSFVILLIIALICIGHFFIFYLSALGFLLLLIQLFILGLPLFDYYNLQSLSIIITTAIKIFVLNIAGMYIQIGFIDLKWLILISSLIFPLFMVELIARHLTVTSMLKGFIVAIQYLVFMPLLYSQLGWLALFYLIGLFSNYYYIKRSNLEAAKRNLYFQVLLILLIFIFDIF